MTGVDQPGPASDAPGPLDTVIEELDWRSALDAVARVLPPSLVDFLR